MTTALWLVLAPWSWMWPALERGIVPWPKAHSPGFLRKQVSVWSSIKVIRWTHPSICFSKRSVHSHRTRNEVFCTRYSYGVSSCLSCVLCYYCTQNQSLLSENTNMVNLELPRLKWPWWPTFGFMSSQWQPIRIKGSIIFPSTHCLNSWFVHKQACLSLSL